VISGVIILGGIISLIVKKGPDLGIDFKGGVQVHIKFAKPVQVEEVQSRLVAIGYQPTITSAGEDEMLIYVGVTEAPTVPLSADPGDGTASSVTISSQQLQTYLFQKGDIVTIEDSLNRKEDLEITSVSTDGDKAIIQFSEPLQKDFTASATIRYARVGEHIAKYLQRSEPTWQATLKRSIQVGANIGKELRVTGILIVIGSMVGLLLYISWRFEVRFAVGAIVALFHDVLFTLGLFSILSKEINLPTLAAFLTIVGYSLNDTIVVFDRIRENVNLLKGWTYIDIINRSINQSLSRTVITSLTTLIVVLAIFFLAGAGELNTFALALIIGVIVGTYSSIFIASPILHGWHLRMQKKES
jgi:preprotein translocase subunit SecF